MSLLRRHSGLLLACLLSAACIGLRVHQYHQDWEAFDRFSLPAFDAYVYLAMIEQPAFFTTYPWGYRFVAPWIAHHLPLRDPLLSYRLLTLGCLVAAGALLYLFLRRLGHSAAPALLAVVLFALSPPVAVLVESPYLADPLALLLELLLLLALQAEVGLWWLALLLVWGVWAKELFLAFPAVLFGSELSRVGFRRAVLRTALVATVPLAANALLHAWWTPHLETPIPDVTFDLLRRAALALFGDSWSSTWPALLLWGITPLAALGALRTAARPFLLRYGILLAPTLALPLLAWLALPGKQVIFMFADNTLRLMVYALPLLLPLALVALDRVAPHLGAAAPPHPLRWSALAACGLVASLAFPVVALDRYQRIPFAHVRDGPLVLTLCRQSLRSARLVEAGRTVVWDLDALGYDPETNPALMQRMRWFLRRGWGGTPHYGFGPAVLQDTSAELLLPVLGVVDHVLVLTLSGAGPIAVSANRTPLSNLQLVAGAAPVEVRLQVPATALFRGDNIITLTASATTSRLQLQRVALCRSGATADAPEARPRRGQRSRRPR